MPVRVEIAETPAQYADGGRLFREYTDFLGVDLGFQDFAGEMAALQVMYGPPDGSLLLAWLDGHCIGAVGLRRLAPGVAEMKRLFVQPGHQGSGAGRALVRPPWRAGHDGPGHHGRGSGMAVLRTSVQPASSAGATTRSGSWAMRRPSRPRCSGVPRSLGSC